MRLPISRLLALVAVLLFWSGFAAGSSQRSPSDYFRSPVGFGISQGYSWLEPTGDEYGCSSGTVYHPGADINKIGAGGDGDKGESLYAIADGEVVYADDSHWASLIIRFSFAGRDYYAVYGHAEIDSGSSDVVSYELATGKNFARFESPYVGMRVTRGQIVGLLWDHATAAAHLHFEIRSSDHPNPSNGTDFCGFYGGKTTAEMKSMNRDPLAFIVSEGYVDGTCKMLDPQWLAGVFCWTSDPVGSQVSCNDGGYHLHYTMYENRSMAVEGMFSDSAKQSYCSHIQNDAVSITTYLGGASTILGGDSGGWPGPGIIIGSDGEPVQVPPDFIVRKTWLVTPWGDETYKFGMQESFDTKAQSENIGDGNCVRGEIDTITGHFYLSRGYKEDVHSGEGAWRRIDSTTTQCDNLKPGDTHTETKNTVISQWITEPGIYNIVYCIDHPQDDHNNGGDHQEKHESNNCSTEAVFEVTANPTENQDPRFVDFVTSSFWFQQAPYYAGDPARFGATISNRGNVGSPAGIRSSYAVQCPGTSLIQLADDGTEASALSSGASAFEENIGTVTMPNVAGTCTATFCADYQGAVTESDEGNNCTSLSFTLQPRPAPKLVITKFRDESGCCTTNTGSRIKPDIWVRNDGPVSPGADVRVIYHISSPVATGGGWWHIGYGSIRPSELPPSGTDEDYMDGSWSIPKNSAWKNQWHTVRGCLKTDGSTPVGDPSTEVCSYYTRFSKK